MAYQYPQRLLFADITLFLSFRSVARASYIDIHAKKATVHSFVHISFTPPKAHHHSFAY